TESWVGRLLPLIAPAGVFAGVAELGVGDAEEFGEGFGGLFAQVAVGAEVRFDDVGRGLLREIDDSLCAVSVVCAARHDALHWHVEPAGQPRDVEAHLRADRNLSEETAKALSELFRVAYAQHRRS